MVETGGIPRQEFQKERGVLEVFFTRVMQEVFEKEPHVRDEAIERGRKAKLVHGDTEIHQMVVHEGVELSDYAGSAVDAIGRYNVSSDKLSYYKKKVVGQSFSSDLHDGTFPLPAFLVGQHESDRNFSDALVRGSIAMAEICCLLEKEGGEVMKTHRQDKQTLRTTFYQNRLRVSVEALALTPLQTAGILSARDWPQCGTSMQVLEKMVQDRLFSQLSNIAPRGFIAQTANAGLHIADAVNFDQQANRVKIEAAFLQDLNEARVKQAQSLRERFMTFPQGEGTGEKCPMGGYISEFGDTGVDASVKLWLSYVKEFYNSTEV